MTAEIGRANTLLIFCGCFSLELKSTPGKLQSLSGNREFVMNLTLYATSCDTINEGILSQEEYD